MTSSASSLVRSPYVGPRAFDEEDQNIFFGRSGESDQLAALVIAHRAVLLYAQSGAGKTSLLQASLVPALKRRKKIATIPIGRVSGEARDDVANIFVYNTLLNIYRQEARPDELAQMSLSQGLAPYMTGEGDGRRPRPHLLILDQFEELFTTHANRYGQRGDFFGQLKACLEAYPTLSLLLSMREDYIAHLDAYAGRLPDRLRSRFRLERLGPEAALQAVVDPLEGTGRAYAPEVAEELVDNLRRVKRRVVTEAGSETTQILGRYVEPVHLQIVCRQLWDNLPAGREVIALDDVQQFGDVDQALTDFYEAALLAAQPEAQMGERRLRGWFDTRLITPAGTRGLLFRGETETAGLPNPALDILVDKYVVRADIRGGETWYELSHDRLVEPVLAANRTWREAHANPLALALEAWQESGGVESQLTQGGQLEELEAYAVAHADDITADERRFLEASRNEQDRRERLAAQRNQRRILIGALVGLLIFAALAVSSLLNAGRARDAQVISALNEQKAVVAQQEAEAAKEEAEFQAEHAADEAHRAQDSASVAAARAVEAQQAEAEAEFQRDEAERQRQEAERQTRLSQAERLAANALAELSSGNNDPSLTLILAREAVNVTRDVDGFVQDNARRALLESVANAPPWLMNLPRYAHEAPVTRGGFSPDGEKVVTGSLDGTAKVWDIATGATLLTLAGHRGSVNSAAYSPDGATIVTGSDDGTIRIWGATSGELLRILDGHDNWVEQASFDPDGERIVSAGSDGVAKVWDVASGEELLILEGRGDRVLAANFDPQGERIVTAGGDGTARIWDAQNGQELLVLEGHDGIVAWAVFDAAGERIVTAGFDGTARVWDAESGDTIALIEGSGSPIVSANFSGDGEQLVTASWDGSGAVWNARRGTLVHELLGHFGRVKFADFSPNDELIMTTGEGRSIRLWDAATAEAIRSLGGGGGVAVDAAFSGDSSRLVVGTEDGMVAVWDVATGDEVARFKAHDSGLTGLDYDQAGQRVATSSEDGTARVWDAETGVEQLVLDEHDGPVTDVAFSPDGLAIATVGQDGRLVVWNADSGEIVLFRTDAADLGIDDVVYSADGSTLATNSESEGQIKIWDGTKLEPRLTLTDQWGTTSVDLSPDGREVVTSNTDGSVSVLDTFGGQALLIFEAHSNFVRSAAFNQDGSLIVTASDDTTARVWDAQTGDERDLLTGHGNWLTSATFSPNGRLVASTDRDGVTKLWAIAGPGLIPELKHDGSPVFQAAFTPDGRRLITNGDDRKVNLWDVESGRQLASRIGLILDRSPFGSLGDTAILPVQDETGSVVLWDVMNDEVVSTLAGHAAWVDAAEISADGQIAVTVGCDEFDEPSETCVQGLAKIWDATSGEESLSLPHEPVVYSRLSNQYIYDGAFELSRDGSRLIAGACMQRDKAGNCKNSLVTIWNTATGEQVTDFETGRGSIWRLEYSPNQSHIYTTGGEGTQVWDSETGALIQELPGEFGAVDLRGERLVTVGGGFTATIWDVRMGTPIATLSGHRDGINSVEFSPNDEDVITSSWDGTARVWNASTGVEILTLAKHSGQVWDAHFSPDGRNIVTTSEDGTALIWPFAVDKLLELSEPSIQRYSPVLTPEELARFGLTGN